MSSKFMDEMADYMVWNVISFTQRLAEWFIDKYKNKLNWRSLCYSQRMSEKFLFEHLYYLDKQTLMLNKKCKVYNSFWRAVFDAYPSWRLGRPEISITPIVFGKDFIREFRDRFLFLNGKIIDPNVKDEKVWKEFGITCW